MTEDVFNNLDRYAGIKHISRCRVTEIVQPSLDPAGLQKLLHLVG